MAQAAAKKIKKQKPSVQKRIRQTLRRTEVNRANRTRVRTAIKQMRAAIAAGDVGAAEKLLGPTMSAIDKGRRLGILQENTANRYKSRLADACNAMRKSKPA